MIKSTVRSSIWSRLVSWLRDEHRARCVDKPVQGELALADCRSLWRMRDPALPGQASMSAVMAMLNDSQCKCGRCGAPKSSLNALYYVNHRNERLIVCPLCYLDANSPHIIAIYERVDPVPSNS